MSEDKDKPHIDISVEQIRIEEGHFNNDPDVNCLPILPTRNLVLFPNVTISISLKRESSETVALGAVETHMPIGIVCQVDPEEDNPSLSKGLSKIGVIADVLKVFEIADGEKTALVRGRNPFKIVGASRKKAPFDARLKARIEVLEDIAPKEGDKTFAVIMRNLNKTLKEILPSYNEGLSHIYNTMIKDENPETIINMMSTNLPFDPKEKESLLSKRLIKDRAKELLKILNIKQQEMDISKDIMQQVKADLDDEQKRMFLQRQIDVIHEHLYGDIDDAEILAKRAEESAMPAEARTTFDRELNKLRHLNPNNPDYFVSQNYLETLLDLPWGKFSEPSDDFTKARAELDRDHCGLDKVKERVMEQMAVIMHNPGGKAPILCLVGPPGVGKTSLGKSIAEALGRVYQRVSLGGLHDEAEIRGHRRTYIGAMPGRIIDAVKRSNVSNPVLVLDEIDKIGSDYKGDPSAALLEVLDPEQNCHFHDNYIDVDFDLSHVLFIATANTSSTIAKPLLDRMETINLSGYLAEEKMEIARKHLIRRIFAEMSIKEGSFEVSDDALKAIIETYTGESGVRQLEKALSKIARRYLLDTMSGKEFPKVVEPAHLKDILGLAPYIKDKYEGNEYAGVACGLAWTEIGGEIILAEASLSQGKGEETVTGNLGQVMKESASIAYQWVKSHASQLGIDPSLFSKYNLHLHFPEGAIPKDGPSAGITIATAIVSAFTQKRVRNKLAMTGEITLRGKVLPVGGIKEKILAAKRAGITEIILSAENKRDIDDIDPMYIQGINFNYVNTVLETMKIAITDEPAIEPISL